MAELTIFDDKQLMAVASLAEASTEVFCRVFMQRTFNKGMSRNHKKACAFLDDQTVRKKNLKSSRGFGKTSLAMAAMAKAILYNQANFIPYITNTQPRAVTRTENLKRFLLTNPLIRSIWPSIKISESQGYALEMDEEFSKLSWVAFGRCLVVPMGALQTPRGMLFNDNRPDLIPVDDAQNMKHIFNEEHRADEFEWVRGDVEEAVDPYSDNYQILHLDTVKHVDGLTERLEGLPDWKTLSLPVAEIRDNIVYSTMPELISHDKVRASYESHKESCTLDVFYREKMCRPMADASMVFLPEYFRHIDEADLCLAKNRNEMDSIILIDPARTPNPQSCESGCVGWTVDRYRPALYCRRAIGRRLMPDELADLGIDMALELGAQIIGIEVTGLGEYAAYPLKNRLQRRGLNLKVIELHAKGGVTERGKIERIKSMLSYYRRGEVYHINGQCERYEKQLLSFPNARYWDIMDAAAYITEALSKGDQFWMPPEFDSLSDREAAVQEYNEIMRDAKKTYVPDSAWGCC